jgi:hypothetical protein
LAFALLFYHGNAMHVINEIFSLGWQPLAALEALRKRAPFWSALACAWLAAFVYTSAAQSLAGYLQGDAAIALAVSGNRWLATLERISPAIRNATMLTLFVGALYAPLALWLGNRFGARAKFAHYWHDAYRGLASCAFAALAFSLLAALPPAVVIGWQARSLSSNAIVGFFVLVLALPLPIFAALMTLTLGVNLSISWGKAVIVTLLSLLSFVGLVILQQAFAVLWLIPLLVLLIAVFLRRRTN